MPDWYPLLRAAKYLGVAPWDLLEHNLAWTSIAIVAEAAETEARDVLAKQQQSGG